MNTVFYQIPDIYQTLEVGKCFIIRDLNDMDIVTGLVTIIGSCGMFEDGETRYYPTQPLSDDTQ